MAPADLDSIGPLTMPARVRSTGSEPPIVYFGNDWFAENRTSSHHVARGLAKQFRVLYVESPGLRAPKATRRDLRKLWHILIRSLAAPARVHPGIWCMTVPQIPFRRVPLIGPLNALLARHMLRMAMRRLGFQNPILWFAVPRAREVIGDLGERLVVYYCTDDHSGLPGVNVAEIARMDEDLTRRADQVFVTSLPLLHKKRQLNPNTLFSPHGVDLPLFRRASDSSLPVAPGARTLRHPVIGFFGLLESWVDLDLLVFLAKARPHWTFLLVGRVAVDLGELARLPNVVVPGPQPYESLPDWSRAFDVAIIPFRQTELIRNANPLKLKEYLATGKPVVSVPIPEVERFADCVSIASTPDEFLRQIENALDHDSEAKRRSRIQAVSGMTWDARVDEVVRVVTSRLHEGQG